MSILRCLVRRSIVSVQFGAAICSLAHKEICHDLRRWKKVMADPRLQPDRNPLPFDGKRLIYGGFEMIVSV